MSQTQRIVWIDNAKGLILFFVLLYHAKFPWHIVGFVSSWFMPCFFLISGLLFGMKNNSLKQTVLHRIKTLLVPYVGLSVLFVFLNPNNYQGDVLSHFKTNAWDILMGNSGFMTVSLWFVYVLFEVCCATSILHYATRKFNQAFRFGTVGIVMAACLVGDAFFHNMLLPFKLSDFFIAWLMYLTGYMLQPQLKHMEDIPISKIAVSAMVMLAVAIVLYAIGYSRSCVWEELRRIGLLLTGAVPLIGIVYGLTQWLKENFICESLRYLANNAMCFLAVHLWVICIYQTYMPCYNPYWAATIALTVSLLVMPLANRYTPRLVGKKRS